MGDAQLLRAGCRAPAARGAPAEGLEDALPRREESRSVSLFRSHGTREEGFTYLFFFGLFGGVFFFFFIAYYVAFGPHGPRAPVNPTGTTVKVAAGVAVLIASAGLIYGGVRSVGMFLSSLLSFCELTGTYSPAATKDDHEGVGRGLERACQGAQNQPHYRSV